MNERYTVLHRTNEQEQPGVSNTPIKFMAGALLLDNYQQEVVSLMKFKNISTKSIKSMLIDIEAFDKNGVKVKGVKDFEYTNLIAGQGDSFGDKIPVPMEDNNTAFFKVKVVSVQFSDGTSWSKNVEAAINVAKTVGKQTTDVTTKVAKRTFPFVANVIVFVILLLVTLSLAISEMTSAYDVVVIVGFSLMTVISFPAFGPFLAKKPNGKKLCLLRWAVVIVVLIILFILGRTIA